MRTCLYEHKSFSFYQLNLYVCKRSMCDLTGEEIRLFNTILGQNMLLSPSPSFPPLVLLIHSLYSCCHPPPPLSATLWCLLTCIFLFLPLLTLHWPPPSHSLSYCGWFSLFSFLWRLLPWPLTLAPLVLPLLVHTRPFLHSSFCLFLLVCHFHSVFPMISYLQLHPGSHNQLPL